MARKATTHDPGLATLATRGPSSRQIYSETIARFRHSAMHPTLRTQAAVLLVPCVARGATNPCPLCEPPLSISVNHIPHVPRIGLQRYQGGGAPEWVCFLAGRPPAPLLGGAEPRGEVRRTENKDARGAERPRPSVPPARPPDRPPGRQLVVAPAVAFLNTGALPPLSTHEICVGCPPHLFLAGFPQPPWCASASGLRACRLAC